MQVEKELSGYSPAQNTVLTIGVFDGVHLGHKHLISHLKEIARSQNLLSGVITFKQHPESIMKTGTLTPVLTSIDEKLDLLGKEGVDIIVALSFTPELAHLSARQFVSLLKKQLNMEWLVIGPDFALGQDRQGDPAALKALGKELGFGVTSVSPAKINGETASSTAIRESLAQGDMEKAYRLYGRYFSLESSVVSGECRGRTLGFPTANLDIDIKHAIPADGIYATLAYIDDKKYRSVTNIGLRPTFGDNKRTIEVYVLDYEGDLYGKIIRIEFIKRLRNEKKFDSTEELKKQISEDIKQSMETFVKL